MSNRSLIEFNHDNTIDPSDEPGLLLWARSLQEYLRTGDEDVLPKGAERKWQRHHSDPCPIDWHVRVRSDDRGLA